LPNKIQYCKICWEYVLFSGKNTYALFFIFPICDMSFVWRQLRAVCFSGVWLLIEAIHLFILQIYTMLGGFVYFVLHYNRGYEEFNNSYKRKEKHMKKTKNVRQRKLRHTQKTRLDFMSPQQ